MKTVGIRELKSRLSEYLRMVRRGEEILITDRCEVIAELRQPSRSSSELHYPALIPHARQGRLRLGEPNRPDLYGTQPRVAPDGTATRLLDEPTCDLFIIPQVSNIRLSHLKHFKRSATMISEGDNAMVWTCPQCEIRNILQC